MTREEAINFTFTIVASTNEEEIGKKEKVVKTPEMRFLIDKIFDDFESRICKNCKWFEQDYVKDLGKTFYWCTNKLNAQIYSEIEFEIEVDENFGCNRFERKK